MTISEGPDPTESRSVSGSGSATLLSYLLPKSLGKNNKWSVTFVVSLANVSGHNCEWAD
jgi:hypothetical protein